MSKKNMESTRELMGTREVTDYSIRTYRNEELVYFLIQPSNISVLSEESLSARIYGLRGVCLYKCGNERYNLMVHAPEYKEKLFGNAGGR